MRPKSSQTRYYANLALGSAVLFVVHLILGLSAALKNASAVDERSLLLGLFVFTGFATLLVHPILCFFAYEQAAKNRFIAQQQTSIGNKDRDSTYAFVAIILWTADLIVASLFDNVPAGILFIVALVAGGYFWFYLLVWTSKLIVAAQKAPFIAYFSKTDADYWVLLVRGVGYVMPNGALSPSLFGAQDFYDTNGTVYMDAIFFGEKYGYHVVRQ